MSAQPASFRLALVSLSVRSLSTDDFTAKLDCFVRQAKAGGAKIVLLPEISFAPIIIAMAKDFLTASAFLETEIKKLAKQYDIYICGGSGIYKIDDKLYNQSFLATPTGDIIYQPKINVIECEKKMGRSGGNKIKIITTPFVKMAICVCYDIEFPELVRQIALQGVDLILNPSYTIDQFGENRVGFCAQARTIENHIYVAKASLVGSGGYELCPSGFGKSALYSPCDIGFTPRGVVAESKGHDEELIFAEVDLAKLYQLRKESSTSPLRDYIDFATRKIGILNVMPEKFHFINGTQLNDTQKDVVMHLLFETGYYANTALENKLNLPSIEFHKKQVLEPYAQHMHILMQGDDIVGVLFAATKSEYEEAGNSVPNWRRDDPKLHKCLEQIKAFYVDETLATDYVLLGIALTPKHRGQGLFKILFNRLKNLARENQCQRVIFTAQDEGLAIEIYKHYGAKIVGNLDFTHYFKDKLLKYVLTLPKL